MKILAILFFVLVSSSAFAETPSLRACLDSCYIWNDQPSYALKACITDCKIKYSRLSSEDEPGWCETYEEDCERDNTPPLF
ncbi:MAG: hypothetical protein M9962_03590 [Oligoflexia bacterium]|nr:hypothetical protein [Oligoflexia bacterium]